MNEFVYTLALDLNCSKTPPVICSGQFDKGRKFEFTITANGEPYDVTGCSAVLKGIRTDGSYFAVECTVSGGKIIKTLDDTTLSVRGKTVAKLVISDSEKSYSTQMFIIDVDSALDGDITVVDDYSILNRLIEQIHALNESGAILIDDTIDKNSNNAVANSAVAIAIEQSTSDLKIAVNPQIATETISAIAGTAIMIRVSGKWLKNSIIRLSIEADDTVINGKVAFGVTYHGSENLSNIAVPYVNTQAIYITTDVTTRFSCYIAKNAVIGNGNITMRVDYLGALEEIANLHNSFEDIKKSLIKNPSYIGKMFCVIGDSYSAYSGWIPDGYNSYYGNDEMDTYKSVTSPAHMWWHILSGLLKMPLICNGSWAGTTICTTGYSGADYTNHAFVTRVKALFGESNTTAVKPDFIFVFGGTNDDWADSPIGELKYSDWATDDLKSVLPAFCFLLDYIKLYNPHATIVNIVNEGMDEAIATGMATACEHYGAVNVELTGIDKLGGHPSALGQATIAEQLISTLKSIL